MSPKARWCIGEDFSIEIRNTVNNRYVDPPADWYTHKTARLAREQAYRAITYRLGYGEIAYATVKRKSGNGWEDLEPVDPFTDDYMAWLHETDYPSYVMD